MFGLRIAHRNSPSGKRERDGVSLSPDACEGIDRRWNDPTRSAAVRPSVAEPVAIAIPMMVGHADIDPEVFVIARIPSIGIEKAHHTLLDAVRFLSADLARSGYGPIEGRYRARVIGNGLRELDRFLSVLLDEVALATGWSRADFRDLARQRNTHGKLNSVCGRLHIDIEGAGRLRALGRCRDTLFHCNGVVRRGDSRDAPGLTLGWPIDLNMGAGAVLQAGDIVSLGQEELRWICGFYTRIGDALVSAGRENLRLNMREG